MIHLVRMGPAQCASLQREMTEEETAALGFET
jgi:hypothetical protein